MDYSIRDIDAALLDAAKRGDLNEVKRLISEGANVNAEDDSEQTPLHLAAQNGYKDIVNTLIKAEANVNSVAFLDITPLLFAAMEGHEDVVEILLKKGADVNSVESFNGMNSLCIAAKKGDEGIVKALLTAKRIDVNAYPQALRFAARNGHEGVVKVLLRKKGIDIKTLSEELDLAAQNGYEGVVKALLTTEQVDVDRYFSALYFAAANGHEGIVKALLTAEQISVSEKDSSGKTTLHWAAERGHIEILNTLLGKKASVNIKDNYGETPLHYAAKNGHIDIVKILLAVDGIAINAKDKNENTPFDLAKTEEIKTLLQNAEKSDPVDRSSTDSEGVQEEDVAPTEPAQPVSTEPAQPVSTEPAQPVAPTEPAQTEEQPSSFFGSLFSILMKPFSLIGSFFGGFFSWLFWSDTDESTSQTDARCEGESSSCDYDATRMDE